MAAISQGTQQLMRWGRLRKMAASSVRTIALGTHMTVGGTWPGWRYPHRLLRRANNDRGKWQIRIMLSRSPSVPFLLEYFITSSQAGGSTRQALAAFTQSNYNIQRIQGIIETTAINPRMPWTMRNGHEEEEKVCTNGEPQMVPCNPKSVSACPDCRCWWWQW